ncbi:MAG: DUF1217 domain-containing protein [Roseobacter sp.]|nr:DUF1217 domain-containing protein [Roseobacter sp.]
MSFQPIVATSGLAGWRLLQNTIDRQTEAYNSAPNLQKAGEYFAENIGNVKSADDLVSDRRLLEVALGAFGLSDDINNKYFIHKVLSEGTTAQGALATKLSDSRYTALANAFGFDTTAQTVMPGFAEKIVAQYERCSFEIAVGEQNETFRFGLNLERELPEIAAKSSSNDAKWYSVMGNAALREVFEVAFGLPSEFGQIDIDQQLEVFKDTAQRRFGTDNLSDLAQPETLDRLTQLYFLQEQINQNQSLNSGTIALTLLQSTQSLQ